jgi:dihydrofolate reductase
MRKLIVGAFVSLDGVMQAPGGPDEDRSGGFEYGGWTFPHGDDTTMAFVSGHFEHPFSLVLGRRTYDIFAGYWPKAKTEPGTRMAHIAQTFNDGIKYVATHAPQSLAWKNSEWLGEDAVARIRELKAQDGPQLLTQGSGGLIQSLLAADLIDTFRLLTYPVLLGKGKKLFAGGAIPGGLKLKNSVVSPSGVVCAEYVRDGAVKTGSFV